MSSNCPSWKTKSGEWKRSKTFHKTYSFHTKNSDSLNTTPPTFGEKETETVLANMKKGQQQTTGRSQKVTGWPNTNQSDYFVYFYADHDRVGLVAEDAIWRWDLQFFIILSSNTNGLNTQWLMIRLLTIHHTIHSRYNTRQVVIQVVISLFSVYILIILTTYEVQIQSYDFYRLTF